jgi:hypothetical protein
MRKERLTNAVYSAVGCIAIGLGIYVAILACKPVQAATYESAYAHSWSAFCEHEGLFEDEKTEENLNRFYDTWRGSALEDAALTADERELIN